MTGDDHNRQGNPDGKSDGNSDGKRLKLRLAILVFVLLALLGLASAWGWSPLRQWLDAARIVIAVEQMGQSVGPLSAILGFALALTLAVPLTFLTLVAIVAFGPTAGFFYTVVGAILGASISFGMGVLLGREVVQRLGGARVNQVSQRLAKHGVLSVAAIRLVPVAPFAVVNMIAGATHLSLRDLLLGTAIGLTPGTVGMIFFTGQLVEALKNPSPVTWAIAVGMFTLIVLGIWALQRWLRAHDGTPKPETHSDTNSDT
jgi:uncharacterized membrane protein YdjX (TVP38/TMEM64 family)